MGRSHLFQSCAETCVRSNHTPPSRKRKMAFRQSAHACGPPGVFLRLIETVCTVFASYQEGTGVYYFQHMPYGLFIKGCHM